MFTWRVKHESLALLTNLDKRGFKLESTRCLFCGRADEDGAHLFIKCKVVKEVWRELAMERERELSWNRLRLCMQCWIMCGGWMLRSACMC